MKARWIAPVVAMGLAALLTQKAAHGDPTPRTYQFKATYAVSGQGLDGHGGAGRLGSGSATLLGKSTLSSGHETALSGPNDRFAVQGRGTLSSKSGSLSFFYEASQLPGTDLFGYFVIYGGTGRFARATGGGRWHEEGGLDPSATDIFQGQLVLH